MGASSLYVNNDSAAGLARVRVISGFGATNSESVLEDREVLLGEAMLQELQGKFSIGEAAFSTTNEAVETCNA